jgi:prepilin-type N-terminal cleavage/methylation domain-containing protein
MNIFSGKINRKQGQAGMSYVELIVVLSIFSVVSTVAMFNYKDFQDRVDLKNLASDVALKIVEAQKSALSGFTVAGVASTWKPSYGVYFATVSSQGADNKNFIYFADISNNGYFDSASCDVAGECVNKTTITKNNFISEIRLFGTGTCGVAPVITIVFKRPDSGATITPGPAQSCTISYAQITVSSPKGSTALIKVYPSGRIEID